jgi:hypothetical protein
LVEAPVVPTEFLGDLMLLKLEVWMFMNFYPILGKSLVSLDDLNTSNSSIETDYNK